MNEIKELKSEAEWQEGWETLLFLRPNLKQDEFLERRLGLQADGYRFFGLYAARKNVSVAGVSILPHVERGRVLWIYDLVTKESERSKGYGVVMLQFLEELAREQRCGRIAVHTRKDRTKAHYFYAMHGKYEQIADVFKKELTLS